MLVRYRHLLLVVAPTYVCCDGLVVAYEECQPGAVHRVRCPGCPSGQGHSKQRRVGHFGYLGEWWFRYTAARSGAVTMARV